MTLYNKEFKYTGRILDLQEAWFFRQYYTAGFTSFCAKLVNGVIV